MNYTKNSGRIGTVGNWNIVSVDVEICGSLLVNVLVVGYEVVSILLNSVFLLKNLLVYECLVAPKGSFRQGLLFEIFQATQQFYRLHRNWKQLDLSLVKVEKTKIACTKTHFWHSKYFNATSTEITEQIKSRDIFFMRHAKEQSRRQN